MRQRLYLASVHSRSTDGWRLRSFTSSKRPTACFLSASIRFLIPNINLNTRIRVQRAVVTIKKELPVKMTRNITRLFGLTVIVIDLMRRKLAPGHTVDIQVRASDGTLSPEFIFTRS